MTQKLVQLDGIGTLTLRKQRRSKYLRITISSEGLIRVSMPYWVPYGAAMEFARSRRAWIIEQQAHWQKNNDGPEIGQRIGKYHRIERSTRAGEQVLVRLNIIDIPLAWDEQDPNAQQMLIKACERALRIQAETLLPQRLKALASKYGYHYKQLRLRKMRSRWGSCSSEANISLNIYLIQLPWDLIDYVMLHELVHTTQHNHSRAFWDELSSHYPNFKDARKNLKMYPTRLWPVS